MTIEQLLRVKIGETDRRGKSWEVSNERFRHKVGRLRATQTRTYVSVTVLQWKKVFQVQKAIYIYTSQGLSSAIHKTVTVIIRIYKLSKKKHLLTCAPIKSLYAADPSLCRFGPVVVVVKGGSEEAIGPVLVAA